MYFHRILIPRNFEILRSTLDYYSTFSINNTLKSNLRNLRHEVKRAQATSHRQQ